MCCAVLVSNPTMQREQCGELVELGWRGAVDGRGSQVSTARADLRQVEKQKPEYYRNSDDMTFKIKALLSLQRRKNHHHLCGAKQQS